jgi:hypothetical protein
MLTIPYVPMISLMGLTGDEKKNAFDLHAQLSEIRDYAQRTIHALELQKRNETELAALGGGAKAAREGRHLYAWTSMATRDSVFSIYHMTKRIETASGLINKGCPSLVEAVDRSKLKSSHAKLKQHFPQRFDVRNAVGHEGERKRDKDGVSGTAHSPGVVIQNSPSPIEINAMVNGRLTISFGGELVSFKLDDESVGQAAEIATEFIEAFIPVGVLATKIGFAADDARIAARAKPPADPDPTDRQ